MDEIGKNDILSSEEYDKVSESLEGAGSMKSEYFGEFINKNPIYKEHDELKKKLELIDNIWAEAFAHIGGVHRNDVYIDLSSKQVKVRGFE